MAAIHPVGLLAGTVREVRKNEFVDRTSGMIEDRGRKVTLLTRAGFAQFNVPTEFASVIFREAEQIAVWVRLVEWSMNSRNGTTLVFESVASADVAGAVLAELVSADPAA